MKVRKVTHTVKGHRAQDGAGVSLVRVLGSETVHDFDPFLMLDSFDSDNRADFVKGFPTHPHRGMETVSFIAKGRLTHRDNAGGRGTIEDGEAQWLTAGSGAFHSEMPDGERLLGLQLWLNLPRASKMTAPPAYHEIKKSEIQEIPLQGGTLRLITGTYREWEDTESLPATSACPKIYKGWQGKYLPLDYYDIHLHPGASLKLGVLEARSVMVFTLQGEAVVCGRRIGEKTAARLDDGDTVTIEAGSEGCEIMFMSSLPTGEPIAWAGPIVMNTQEELRTAFRELQDGTFLKAPTAYSGR